MNQTQEKVYNLTLDYFKEVIPNYTDEQLEFAKDITERLILDKDTSKVNAVPAPCGFGKSVIIRCYLKANIISRTVGGFGASLTTYEGSGFVVITDLLERFNEFEEEKELEGYYYQMDHKNNPDDFPTQIVKQDNYPILLMTTQKYFKLKENERGFIFKWKHGERKTIIFDEQPLFYSITDIDKEFINDIDENIDRMLETEDKDFLTNEVKYLRDYLDNERNRLSSLSEKDIYCYWKGSRLNISTDNERFLKLTDEYLTIENKDRIKILQDILKNGAIFVNKKGKMASDSRRFFFTIKDNKDEFYLSKDRAKFWIFDATADIDVEYKRDYIDIIKVVNTKKHNIKLRNFDIGTSRGNMKKKAFVNMLNNYLLENYSENTLIVSYMNNIKNDFNRFKFKNYPGGMKGLNDYSKLTNYVQVGLNRFSDIVYLQIFLSLHPEVLDYIKKNPNKSEEEFNDLLELEGGNFVNDKMNEIMYSKILVDTEQNIFRVKLRDYSNTDTIFIDLIYNATTYEKLNELLEERLGEKAFVGLPEQILEYNILSRENETESIAQKIVRWFSENRGYGEIRTRDLLKVNNISDEQFKNAKKDSKSLVQFMDSKRIKKGIYSV
ncbi:hypothetical protein [Tissierella sp.]|uniref:hypothetical protein n=1 Tax=Tissierella sp. TaxID=41274 RepID=UPI0028AE7AB9|nr:hypothetical protein [Tissierella sp.]